MPSLDWSKQLTEREVVVALTDHISHDITDKLKPACDRSGARWVYASWGRRAVLQALSEVGDDH
jgi:hypothetical protein